MTAAEGFEDECPLPLSAEGALAFAFQAVEADQYDLNRRAASRAGGIAEALGWARSHPEIYAVPGDSEPVRTAERCAVWEAASRLHVSENTIRTLAYTADEASAHLPLLWHQAREGFVPLNQVEVAVALLPRFAEHPDGLREFDRMLADVALHATPAAFRKRAAALARRFAPVPEAVRHADAFRKRRVFVDHGDDGMSWTHLYTRTVDAVAAERRARVTAKNMDTTARDGRTTAQIQADLYTAWLRGENTPTGVKTKVFVTVPLDQLSKTAHATVRSRISSSVGVGVGGGVDLNDGCQLVGHGDLDDATARQLLVDAGAFTRVVTDPVTGVILDMDRRSRKVTRAQREWLMLTHGTCVRDGCTRLTVDADIDHYCGYHSPQRGPTNIDNLGPLCGPDHALKDTTKVRFRRREDLSIELAFPTGYSTYARIMTRPPSHPDSDVPPF